MVKKGKYNLFSFSIEDEMIKYHSKNNVKKYVFFSILKTNSLKKLVPLLNSLLVKGMMKYYSIQFSNKKNYTSSVLFNFQDEQKENILKSLKIIKEDVREHLKNDSLYARFLRGNELNKEYVNIIEVDLGDSLEINNKKDFCIVKNKKKIRYIKLYSLYFIQDSAIESLLNIFFNLITDLGIKGNLILNFILKNGLVVFSPFFVEHFYNKNIDTKLVEMVNEFISSELSIREENIKMKLIGNLLWRLNFSKNFIDYKNNESMLFSLFSIIQNGEKSLALNGQKNSLSTTKKFMTLVIEVLKRNNFNFNKIDFNVLEINNQYIILTIDDFNPSLIYNTFKKYYPKRIIYLVIHNQSLFKKILLETKISNLLGVKVFNPIGFIKFLKKARSLKSL